ncbi:sulfite exporter TauE/SafE family protein [Cohnella cellulosilytica]|uniref:Sulfite exporter TauE/SafE family protein n=1 Tax=Cohnella cellulosilytica TaxID=986710 RepID=A0ABW2FB25_9BACL
MMLAQSLLLAAAAGLAGAPHCLIMCGGITSSIVLNAGKRPIKAAAAYHAGRLTTYTATGAFMGIVGSFLNAAGTFVGLQSLASIAGGALIIAWTYWRFTLPYPHRFFPFGRKADRRLTENKREGAWMGTYSSGVLLGFLPCGLTYAMQMNAAASGSWAEGAALLLAFGLATVPVFALLALFSGRLGKGRKKIMRAAGTALAYTMGILAILKGMAANGWIPSVHPWLW